MHPYFQFSLPLEYFFKSRIKTTQNRISWVFIYPLPVIILTYAGTNSSLAFSLGLSILSIVLIYTLYEFGYLVNDAITVCNEVNPTLRLSDQDQKYVALNLRKILILRTSFAILTICLIATLEMSAGISWEKPTAIATLSVISIYAVFFGYNKVRGRITIPLFISLVSLRFGCPILIATHQSRRPLTIQLISLFLIYPLACGIEFAGKRRFNLSCLRSIPRKVDAWRIWYYSFLTLAAWFILPTSNGDWLLLRVGSIYFLLYRILAFLIGRPPSQPLQSEPHK